MGSIVFTNTTYAEILHVPDQIAAYVKARADQLR